ncbi:HAD family hydrolase [Actinacidiphila sp. bgisy160]|uniref:HAD family hydrolase n=1 Tax=Actinacidiphila sp. bgisy160 TaxID=3413796 RepID=UPI003D7575B8
MASIDPEWLLSRVRGVNVVLFDFDGPLCDLFAVYTADAVAERMKKYLRCKRRLLTDFASYTDTHQLLYDVAERDDIPGRIGRGLDRVLVRAERRAAKVARPTEGAAELVELLARARLPIAITTNNSAAAVRIYLKKHGLARPFGERIFGREAPQLMKPDPHCLLKAMRQIGSGGDPGNCLMIGDSVRDLKAASSAGVRFLAYAAHDERDPERGERLLEAGADFLVSDMREVTEAFTRADLGCWGAPVRE